MKSLLNTEQIMRYLTHLSRRGMLLCFVARTQKQTPKEGAFWPILAKHMN